MASGFQKNSQVIIALPEVKKDQYLRQLKICGTRFLFSLQLKSSAIDDVLLFELI